MLRPISGTAENQPMKGIWAAPSPLQPRWGQAMLTKWAGRSPAMRPVSGSYSSPAQGSCLFGS